MATGAGIAPAFAPSKGAVLRLDDPAFKWWPARVTRPVPRIKSPLHHFNACRPKWRSRQEWTSQVLRYGFPKRDGSLSRTAKHLHWRRSRRRASALGYASKRNGASSRGCTGKVSLQKKSAGCCMEAEWSQSPVPPRTMRAYETRLSAGSTAEPSPGVAPS